MKHRPNSKTIFYTIEDAADITVALAILRRENADRLYVYIGRIRAATARQLWKLFAPSVVHLTIDFQSCIFTCLGMTHLFPMAGNPWYGKSLVIVGVGASFFGHEQGHLFEIPIGGTVFWNLGFPLCLQPEEVMTSTIAASVPGIGNCMFVIHR